MREDRLQMLDIARIDLGKRGVTLTGVRAQKHEPAIARRRIDQPAIRHRWKRLTGRRDRPHGGMRGPGDERAEQREHSDADAAVASDHGVSFRRGEDAYASTASAPAASHPRRPSGTGPLVLAGKPAPAARSSPLRKIGRDVVDVGRGELARPERGHLAGSDTDRLGDLRDRRAIERRRPLLIAD